MTLLPVSAALSPRSPGLDLRRRAEHDEPRRPREAPKATPRREEPAHDFLEVPLPYTAPFLAQLLGQAGGGAAGAEAAGRRAYALASLRPRGCGRLLDMDS